jgi:hypothetical protein
LRSRQTTSMSLSSGAYLDSHTTVSQCDRAARAASESLLRWIGPFSSTSWAKSGADLRPDRPGRWRTPRRDRRDRDASRPRSRRRREERCRRLRPDACAVAGASRSDPPRWRSGAPSPCAGVAASGTFFRNALDNCDRLMRTPSRASISARRRAIVQFGLSATGSSSKGVTTRNAMALFAGAGLGATLAFKRIHAALRPTLLRHSRAVSSRTLNASAIRGLPQPDRVSSPRALGPLPRDHVTLPEPSTPGAVRHSPQSQICRPCPANPNRSQQRIAKPPPWSANQNLLRRNKRQVLD